MTAAESPIEDGGSEPLPGAAPAADTGATLALWALGGVLFIVVAVGLILFLRRRIL